MNKQMQRIFSGILILLWAAAPVHAAKYKTLKGGVKNGGTVTGRIVFEGTPPPPRMLKVDKDPDVCGGNRPSEELLVGKNGGIKNVVVSISGIKKGKKWNLSKKFVYDQQKCRFVPHVLLIRPKAKGSVLNSDSVGHNFHTVSKGIYNINKKIKANGKMKVKKKKIKKSGKIRVKCDLHTWMGGWWIVAESPYTELSDEEGNFTITDVPAGKYTLKVWQEKLGALEQQITVEAGAVRELEIKMKL